MTAKEKITEAAKMAASYEYNASYSSSNEMVAYGGGDCWASTALTIDFCKKLGYDGWVRNGSHDLGAGSGHRNAMIKAEGKYYEVEAGYYESAPRSYDVTERTSLFSYINDYQSGGIYITQYDGKTKPENMVVPEYINGKKVVGLGEYCFYNYSGVKIITLPKTIDYINKGAFSSCADLQSINIPASVTTIGDFVFSNCDQLTSIVCDGNNQYFSSTGTVLYNKDKTTLLYAPAVASMLVPSTVDTIANYAFYYNDLLTNITMSSVVTIEEGAFCYCTSLESINFGKKLAKLGDYACAADGKLNQIIIPATLTNAGENIFHNCTNLQSVCYGGSKENWTALGITDDCFTTAEFKYNYTESDEKSPYALGDINADDEINAVDALQALRHSVSEITLTGDAFTRGDVYKDNKVDATDALQILRYSVKEITAF